MRKNGEYQPEPRPIRHVRETLHMLSVLTGDSRFEDVNNEGREGVRTMCEVLDRIEKRGEQRGLEQGRKQGIEQGIGQGREEEARAIVLHMLDQGIEIATIAQLTGISLEKVKNIVASVTN